MKHHLGSLRAKLRIIVASIVVVLIAMIVVLPVLANSTWTATGSLANGRAEHQAVRLNDGRVLVVGGRLSTTAAGTAEIYDPATRTWSATGPRNFASKSSVSLLADGRVLVAGSDGGYYGAFNGAEIYDPATNAWAWTGSMAQARGGHLAVRLKDGRVLVAGDQWGATTAEIYDPATGLWSATGSMNTQHGNGTVSQLPDGRVLVAGGGYLDALLGEVTLATAEIYDPATATWQLTGSLNTARKLHTATQLADGRILVAAGRNANNAWLASTEIYDPATGLWSPTGSLNNARYAHTATLLANGQVLVAGMPDVPGVNLLSAEWYDPAASAWSSTTDLPEARWSHSATLLTDGDVLLAGGLHNDPTGFDLPSAVLYTPGDSAPPPPPPTPTSIPQANQSHVGDLDGARFLVDQRNWRATVTILVLDNNDIPVANATVSGKWSGGISGNATCTTGGSGTCSVTSSNVRTSKSSVSFTVSNVSHATLAYNAAANRDPDGDSNGTTITVSKP